MIVKNLPEMPPVMRGTLNDLVEQYMDMVYAAAVRQVRDPHLAADVTQAVFLILQRKLPRFGPGTIISAWLLRTTRYASLEALRRERRRLRHEGKAATMREKNQPVTEMDPESSGMIDEALNALGTTDRAAIVLTYFEGQSHAELGSRLGISTDAAHKRVQRALGKMRRLLSRRGRALPVAGVAAALAVIGKPATAPAVVHNAVMGSIGGQSPAVVQMLAKGTMMQLAKVKVGIVVTAAVIGVSTAGFVMHEMARGQSVPAVAPAAATAPAAKGTPLEQLAARYKLEPGQNLRRIQDLPEPDRKEFVELTMAGQYLNPDGTLNPMYHNAVFSYKDGRLERMAMGFAASLPDTLNFLRVNWYNVDHLDRINYWNANPSRITYGPGRTATVKFNAPPADWVMRDGAATADLLADLAKIISEDTKRPFTFKHGIVRRPCVVVKGNVHAAPEDKGRFQVVAVTLNPAPDEMVKSWLASNGVPSNTFTGFQLPDISEKLDAPLFSSVTMRGAYKFIVTKDAILHHGDADFKEKLGTVLTNLEAQMGGTWTIEDRDMDVYEPVEEKGAPAAVP